jgi:class 3 adenylate cyclase
VLLTLESTTAGVTERLSFDTDDPIWIGRSSQCHIQVGADSGGVSRQHARLVPSGQSWTVEDQSRLGTLLNGKKLGHRQRSPLRLHDELRIGPLSLRVVGLGGGIEQTVTTAFARSSVDFAALDPQLVLKSAMELPRLFGDALDEGEVLQTACDFLVRALSPIVSSAYVVETGLERVESSRMLARRSLTDEGAPVLSRRIIGDAIRNDQSVIFFDHASSMGIEATVKATTRTVGACLVERNPSGDPVVIYVVGERTMLDGKDIAAGYLSLVATLTRQHLVALRRANLANYFSPKVVELLMRPGGRSSAEGEPRVVEATSLFFDLRDFSLSAEAAAADLLRLHGELRRTMDVVTREIFSRDGTVIDYQGDGCFAAWGVPFEQPDQARAAVRCAIRIVEELSSAPLRAISAPSGAVCGIAIAKGQVLAGSMGFGKHMKYGLLGPSVNCAARVEALTKPGRLNAPLLITEDVAVALDATHTPFVRAARVGLAGIQEVINVYEVLAAGRRLSSPENAARWEALLCMLECVRCESDLQKLRGEIQRVPFRDDPRVLWLLDFCTRLETAKDLSAWDGIVRYEK